MISLCRSATFAALVAGSGIALLTGAQADTLTFGTFGPSDSAAGFFSTGEYPFLVTGSAPYGSGPASFDGRNGTFTISPVNFSVLAINSHLIGGISNFTVSFPDGDSLTGSVELGVPVPNPYIPTFCGCADAGYLFGTLTVTAISGDPTFVSNFGGIGGKDNFSWDYSFALDRMPPILGEGSLKLGTGEITPVDPPSEAPLPGAIYLFGSALGGAFWLGRRKRTLGAAVVA